MATTKLRIVSDGTGSGTIITAIDESLGVEVRIDNVISIQFDELVADGQLVAKLTLFNVELDVIASHKD